MMWAIGIAALVVWALGFLIVFWVTAEYSALSPVVATLLAASWFVMLPVAILAAFALVVFDAIWRKVTAWPKQSG
jgi:hypothetical protein